MINKLLSLTSAIFVFACSQGYSQKNYSGKRVFDFPINNQEHSIVVIQDGISENEAKEKAYERASEITVDNGYKYFYVIKEDQVEIMKGKENWPSSYDFPQNLYQEEIIEKGFNRERFIQQGGQNHKLYSAYRINIEFTKKKSSKTINACEYTHCGK